MVWKQLLREQEGRQTHAAKSLVSPECPCAGILQTAIVLKAKSWSGVVGEGVIPLVKVLWEHLACSASLTFHFQVGHGDDGCGSSWDPPDDSIKRQVIPCNLKVLPTPNVKNF